MIYSLHTNWPWCEKVLRSLHCFLSGHQQQQQRNTSGICVGHLTLNKYDNYDKWNCGKQQQNRILIYIYKTLNAQYTT